MLRDYALVGEDSDNVKVQTGSRLLRGMLSSFCQQLLRKIKEVIQLVAPGGRRCIYKMQSKLLTQGYSKNIYARVGYLHIPDPILFLQYHYLLAGALQHSLREVSQHVRLWLTLLMAATLSVVSCLVLPPDSV